MAFRSSIRAILRASLVASAFGLALEMSASAAPQVDLSPLLASPTPAEMDAVRADWNARRIVAEGFQLDATGLDVRGDTVHIISHTVDGKRHYGALRFPRNYFNGGSFPLFVTCHGGLNGVDIDQMSSVLSNFPGECVDDEAFLLIPSFRGEDLVTPFAGTFTSDGVQSFADRDVDDTIALLSVALNEYPEIDEARVGAYGISRGGTVALLAGIRDPRIRRVVDMYGFTDLSLPSVRQRLEEIVNHGAAPTGIGRVVWENSAEGWLNGTVSLADARLGWLRSSPCYFASDMRSAQAHHGLSDTQVDSSHTVALLDALSEGGFGAPEFSGYLYPGGLHGLSSLDGNGFKAESYLCALQVGPRGYCGPMMPNADGRFAAVNFEGSCSLTENNFEFRAERCSTGQFGLLFASPTSGYVPNGGGFVCLGVGLQRVGTAATDAAGNFSMQLDFATQDPKLAPFYGVGQTVHFQVAYRDPLNTLAPYNWSNGLILTLEP